MLSTENPPVDLSCSSSSPIISQICSDEKGPNHSNQQLQPKLDLPQSSLDENKKQVSNFSIRDYVFSSRDKDIKTHWPFSSKNLQFCLKHGVSSVLPPFQTPYSVRNPSPGDSQAQDLPETSNKVVRTTSNPGKSCKLIAKPTTEPKPSKELMKTTAVADSMASKVCPVCKTFSSSSNTTLNAHIDQCLSGGTASNSTAKSKLIIKHRIKPRKIRLMEDIYETALRCTLEDLDRRNGTNWASGSNPAKDLEVTLSTPSADNNEEDNEMLSSVKVADKDVDGAVYVDSTGTKLRILSKFSDLQSDAKSIDDRSLKKRLVKGNKAHKFLFSKKKYLLKNHKLLKSSSHSKVLDRCPKAVDDEQENVSSREGFEKRDQRIPLELCGRMKATDLGIVKKWVGSKRTILKKKNNLEHKRHSLQKATMENLSVTKRLSPLSSNHEFTNDSSLPLSSDKITSQDEHLRKRTEKNNHGKKSHPSLSKCKDSSKDGTSEYNRCSRDHISSSDEEQARANVSPVVRMSRHQAFSSGSKGFAYQKSPSVDHKVLPHGKKFSSSKKNPQSNTKLSSVSGSKRSIEMKHTVLKKRRLRYASESDEEYIVPRSTIRRQDELVHETLGEDSTERERLFDEPSNDRFKDLKVQKNRLGYANSGLKDSLGSIGRCIQRNSDSYVHANTATCTLNTEETFKVDGSDFIAFDKYLDSPLPPYDECVPRHYVKAGVEVTAQSGLVLIDEKDAFRMNNDKHLVISNSDAVMDIDASEGERNHYASIDPIPIPGPPGSFLPSPGRMGSDELQGSSSLTTCKIHSEDDEREVVDKDSSDSPISATSIVSNSIIDRSDSTSVIDPSKKLSSDHDMIQSDFLNNAKIYRSAAGSSTQFDQEREEQHRESRAEMSPNGLIKSGQPCCCSRKEMFGQHNVNSISLHPAKETEIDWNVKAKNNPEPNEAFTNLTRVSHNLLGSPSPSTPNPVLRLMGKNLMVVNKEENFSPETRPAQSAANGHSYSRSFSDKGLSDKQYRQCSYNDTVLNQQGPLLFDGGSQTTIHGVEFGVHEGFRTHGGFRKPELFPQKSFNGSFTYRECAAGGLGPTRDPVKVTKPVELIVIDGSPRNEAVKPFNHHVESACSMPSNPFYIYPMHNHQLSRGGGAHEIVQNSYCTQGPYSVGIMQENSRILSSQNSFTASSSLPGLARSSPYASHGFLSDENFS